ncbi:hypothetical protein KCU99_g1312, partial [Aureobasidium melanogenum]
TAAGIPTWSPTVVLICRSTAYVWQSGRDAQFSADCGRTCLCFKFLTIQPPPNISRNTPPTRRSRLGLSVPRDFQLCACKND